MIPEPDIISVKFFVLLFLETLEIRLPIFGIINEADLFLMDNERIFDIKWFDVPESIWPVGP